MMDTKYQQDVNRLRWVAAMLSGQYKHGTHLLFNSDTGCYCAIGVATQLFHDRPEWSNEYCTSKYWFLDKFGSLLSQEYISAVNDRSKDYLAVCALVLDRCDNTRRKEFLVETMQAASLEPKREFVFDSNSEADLKSKLDAIQPDTTTNTNPNTGKA